MSDGFRDRVAIVTGAGDELGLGFAHARYLAERGAKVLVCDLGGNMLGLPGQENDGGVAERAAERIRAAGGSALSNNASVTDPANAEAMVQRCLDEWGRLDIIVNNAGFASAQFFPNVDNDEMQRHFEVTMLGCLNTSRAAWPHMVERGYGRIVHTGSAACFGNPVLSYASTKAGLFGLTKVQALYGAEHDIRVNLLLPCAFSRMTNALPDSPFKERLRDDFPSEKVSPVVGHLAHENCDVSGEAFSVGGGRFARVVYAATDAAPIDDELESVEKAMAGVMGERSLNIIRSTDEDMWNLGFPADEQSH